MSDRVITAPLQDLQHRPITHLGHTQLPQHAGPFRRHQRLRRTHTPPRGVKHLPELVSRTYRNRVLEP
jgi:hypothetical protein